MHSGLLRDLEKLLGSGPVLFQPEDVLLYEYDGSVEKGRPDIVVFPTTTQEVSQIVKLAAKHNVPIVGRGAGTGLSGGALARTGGLIGGIGGSVIGLLGALLGSLTARRRARGFVLGLMLALTLLGAGLIVVGGIAVALRQPYAVWFLLLLGGTIMAVVFGNGLRTAHRAFEDAELRKMRALDLSRP